MSSLAGLAPVAQLLCCSALVRAEPTLHVAVALELMPADMAAAGSL